MFNSKLKLQGLSLEEIINEGVHGNNPEVTIDDWKFIEHLLKDYLTPEQIDEKIQEQLDETADVNYCQGLSDGGFDAHEIERLQDILKENKIEY